MSHLEFVNLVFRGLRYHSQVLALFQPGFGETKSAGCCRESVTWTCLVPICLQCTGLICFGGKAVYRICIALSQKDLEQGELSDLQHVKTKLFVSCKNWNAQWSCVQETSMSTISSPDTLMWCPNVGQRSRNRVIGFLSSLVLLERWNLRKYYLLRLISKKNTLICLFSKSTQFVVQIFLLVPSTRSGEYSNATPVSDHSMLPSFCPLTQLSKYFCGPPWSHLSPDFVSRTGHSCSLLANVCTWLDRSFADPAVL